MTKNITPSFTDPESAINPTHAGGNGKTSEAALYKMLVEEMPDDWYAIWGNHLGDHEYDFLVAVPGRGVVNLECKGRYIADTNNGSFIAPDGRRKFPISQACDAMAFYSEELGRLLNKQHWGLWGYAVVFPLYDFKDEKGEIRDFGDKPIYTAADCNRLGIVGIVKESLNKAEARLRKKRGDGPITLLSEDDANTIWDEWRRTATPVDRVYRNADIENMRNIMRTVLTYVQQDALRKILATQYVHVIGSAGTGKTLLALRAAGEFLSKGKAVLYVCFNQLIAEEVRIMATKGRMSFDIKTFHTLDDLCLGRNIKKYSLINGVRSLDEAAFDRDFNTAMYNAGSKVRYDVIIVDEGQDFNSFRIESLLPVLKPNESRFVLFSDREQAIYQNPDALTVENLKQFFNNIQTIVLDKNIRNTIEIADFCKSCIPDQDLAPSSMEGVRVEEFAHSEEGLNEWISEKILPQYAPSNVAVLSNSEDFIKGFKCSIHGKSFYGKAEKANDSRKNLERWHKGECGWKSTIHAFKGLEADVVILVLRQDPQLNEAKRRAIRYVGASRARYQLYVITVEG